MDDIKPRMEKVLEALRKEFVRLRTGRATLALLDGIRAESYGSELPLNQVGTLSIPEGRTIVINPWDKGVIPAIEKAIMKSDLGLQPVNDGKVVRVTLPVLTEERRKELVKVARKCAEESRVSIRNVRREVNEVAKKKQKDGKMTEDELRRSELETQKMTDQYTAQADKILEQKEKEIMEV